MKYELSKICWGGDRDLAADLEDVYEACSGMSAVYWEDPEGEHVIGEDLACRDEVAKRCGWYVCNGYTSEFEDWGQVNCDRAVEDGCKTVDDVYGWFLEHFKADRS